jgi:lipopolysaccharide biosynthesis protein
MRNIYPLLRHYLIEKTNHLAPPMSRETDYSLAVHLHIFHEEYLNTVIKYFERNRKVSLFISVPNEIFKNELESNLTQVLKLDVRVVPNKGRNFAPLFVEFGEELGKFDLVLHLHSKFHQNSYKRKKWANSLWDHLLLNEMFIETALAYFNERANLGLYYPRDFRWYPHSIGWNGTEAKSKFHFVELAAQIDQAKALKFPIGGMFLTRGANISYISETINSWNLFPAEADNQDEISQGLTLEHSLERLISQVNIYHGYDALIYDCNLRSFLIEPALNNFKN